MKRIELVLLAAIPWLAIPTPVMTHDSAAYAYENSDYDRQFNYSVSEPAHGKWVFKDHSRGGGDFPLEARVQLLDDIDSSRGIAFRRHHRNAVGDKLIYLVPISSVHHWSRIEGPGK